MVKNLHHHIVKLPNHCTNSEKKNVALNNIFYWLLCDLYVVDVIFSVFNLIFWKFARGGGRQTQEKGMRKN